MPWRSDREHGHQARTQDAGRRDGKRLAIERRFSCQFCSPPQTSWSSATELVSNCPGLVQLLEPPRALTSRGRLAGARTGGTTGQPALWSVRNGVGRPPVELQTARQTSAHSEHVPPPISPFRQVPFVGAHPGRQRTCGCTGGQVALN